MVANHFSGTANDFLRRNDFPGDTGGTADKNSMRTARVELAGAKSPTVIIAVPDKFPAVIVARPDTNPREDHVLVVGTGLSDRKPWVIWRSVIGAAMHPVALFAVEPACGEEELSRPRDIYSSERREFTSLISPAAIQHAASPELDRRSNHVTPAGYVIASPDDSLRGTGTKDQNDRRGAGRTR